MSTQRKAYHWKFRDRDDPKKINEWMNNQDNIRDSLTFILHQWIEEYGNTNVNSYQFREGFLADHSQSKTAAAKDERQVEKTFKKNNSSKNSSKAKETNTNKNNLDYSQIDKNSL